MTASLIFKGKKLSYLKSVSHPFRGDYLRLRQNLKWKRIAGETGDQYVVFADIVNKITRSSGKVSKQRVIIPFERHKKNNFNFFLFHLLFLSLLSFFFPLDLQCVQKLLVLSTCSMIVMDQRTLQIKYRIPVSDIFRISLSPYSDDIVIIHVRCVS